MLTASNIHKSFKDNTVLSGVDIQIEQGSITCLIGPSGSGKTTLLRALALLDYPDQGRIDVDGRSYEFPLPSKQKVDPPWPHVTAVFQSLFLWPHLTLRENIMLPAKNIEGLDAESYLSELIDFFEMKGFIDQYPNQASIGQRQRVAVARALILNPSYILMDEITSALDIEQSAKILVKLSQLKDRNMGIFLITHHIGFARQAADQIVFTDAGKIVEAGPPSILDNPQTERLQSFVSLLNQTV